jgi:uncharacterized protein with NRDE domain
LDNLFELYDDARTFQRQTCPLISVINNENRIVNTIFVANNEPHSLTPYGQDPVDEEDWKAFLPSNNMKN